MNIKKDNIMDVNIFHDFIILSESESFSQAAKKLFISQPALTKKISNLEEKLGCVLINRKSGRLSLTRQGKIFLKYSKSHVVLEHDFQREIQESLHVNLNSVLVATNHRGGDYAARILPGFEKKHQILVCLNDFDTLHCEDNLISGNFELAIFTTPVFSREIEYLPIAEDILLWVAPKDCIIFAGKELSGNSVENPLVLEPDEFKNPDLKYLLCTDNHGLYYAERDFFQQYNIHPQKYQAVDYVNTRYTIASAGGGIVLVPTVTIQENQSENVYFTIKGGIHRYIIIAKNKNLPLSNAANLFWNYVIKCSMGTV